MINSGKLDRRIQLQSRAAGSDSEYNTPSGAWSTYATVWAYKEHHQETEGEADGRHFASYALYLTIRWRSDLDHAHRIILNDVSPQQIFEIRGEPREIGRKEFLKFKVRLVE